MTRDRTDDATKKSGVCIMVCARHVNRIRQMNCSAIRDTVHLVHGDAIYPVPQHSMVCAVTLWKGTKASKP